MAVDYDLICRQDALGPLLAAAFMLKENCRILLLPPLPDKSLEPSFLIPVVRGYPASLLSSLMELEKPPVDLFSWQGDTGHELDPDCISSGTQLSAFLESNLAGSEVELEQLWQLLDACMARGLEMPAASLGGIGQMLWLLVRNEALRERRKCSLLSWLEETGISGADQQLWRSLIPLISLSRFKDPPLLSFAYGLQTLLQPDGWFEINRLKKNLLEYLLSNGVQQVDQEWGPVFDGKWFIGVGENDKVARRATLYLADSNPLSLMQEVPLPRRRRDFKRQFMLDDPGFLHHQTLAAGLQQSAGQALYHLDCRGAHDLTGTTLLGPAGSDGQSVSQHRWQAVEVQTEAANAFAVANSWGWQPRLPAMMGGGFLPLSGSFCRFYQLGWHNLPGFGLGGLIYSAHQVAVSVLKTDLKR